MVSPNKLELKNATFNAPKDNFYSSVSLEFANGRRAALDFELKRNLLDQNIVYVDFEDLPKLDFKDESGEVITVSNSTKDFDVVSVARKYADFLDGKLKLSDGEILFNRNT